MVLGDRIHRRQGRALGLGGANRREPLPVGGVQFPIVPAKLLERALLPLHQRPSGRAVHALAVDAHARGDDEPLDRMARQRLEQNRRAIAVYLRVVGDLVHALAHADQRRKMIDGVHALKRLPDRLRVTDIAVDDLHLGGEISGPLALASVHLRRVIVEHAHLVPFFEKFIGHVRTDEARAAGDQDPL